MKQTAFTLIELLVVIVIIGILATISTATFQNYLAKANDVARQAAIEQMADIIMASQVGISPLAYDDLNNDSVLDVSDDNTPFVALMNQQGYSIPDRVKDISMVYNSSGDEFYIAFCSEVNEQVVIVSGSSPEAEDDVECRDLFSSGDYMPSVASGADVITGFTTGSYALN